MEFVSWDDAIPNIWEQKCSKPPTSQTLNQPVMPIFLTFLQVQKRHEQTKHDTSSDQWCWKTTVCLNLTLQTLGTSAAKHHKIGCWAIITFSCSFIILYIQQLSKISKNVSVEKCKHVHVWQQTLVLNKDAFQPRQGTVACWSHIPCWNLHVCKLNIPIYNDVQWGKQYNNTPLLVCQWC